ncbi:hypothetical protein ACFFJB_09665 [Camelimonas abortus]|uniref:CoxF protein n=1 Tax=Camelimonas abortus TaxID=1017184 RepID=A0ABV7LE71_9HYPH
MEDHKQKIEYVTLTPEQKRRRSMRNVAIAVILAAFVAVLYVVTYVKLGVNVLKRPM